MKREVHITPLNSSPSLIYNPQLQYHLVYTPNSQNQAEFNPPLPVDRFWHVDWVNSNKKIKKKLGQHASVLAHASSDVGTRSLKGARSAA